MAATSRWHAVNRPDEGLDRWLKIGPAPKNVTDKALGASRDIWAASGIPPGVPTVRPSRRGHDADVILARGSQYSTQPASASHTFFTKLQLGKKEKKMEIDFR